MNAPTPVSPFARTMRKRWGPVFWPAPVRSRAGEKPRLPFAWQSEPHLRGRA